MPRWAIDLAEALRGQSGSDGADGADGVTLRIATVTSVNPLGISINGAAITRNVYCNPAYTLEGYDTVDKLQELFIDAPEPAALFDFLEAFQEAFMLHPGDSVLTAQIGTSFYVVERVVSSI